MEHINLKARAKINLTLDVTGKRADGYHDLKMIMQTVTLYDGVYIKRIGRKGIKLKSNLDWLPSDEKNIAYRAASLLQNEFNIKEGIFIELNKRIPVAAGLAGGSSDCAAVLVGMNRIFELNLTIEKLMEYGLMLGSDVPYCISRGTALAEGVGERLTYISPFPECYIVLAKPTVNVSTAYVYKNLDLSNIKIRPKTNKMIEAINRGDVVDASSNLCNVLETVTIPLYPVIDEIKVDLKTLGATGSLMSGSGPTVFGIFTDKDLAVKAALFIKTKYNIRDVFVTGIFNNNKKGEIKKW